MKSDKMAVTTKPAGGSTNKVGVDSPLVGETASDGKFRCDILSTLHHVPYLVNL